MMKLLVIKHILNPIGKRGMKFSLFLQFGFWLQLRLAGGDASRPDPHLRMEARVVVTFPWDRST